MLPESDITAELLDAIEKACNSTEFLEKVRLVLENAQLEVEKLDPKCHACGGCCRFDEMDHRLFASTGELALLKGLKTHAARARLRCSWQGQDKCFARKQRPLGCRMFFCDDGLTDELQSIYEKYHAQLVDLHRKYGVRYIYCEMTAVAWEICGKQG